MGLIPVAENLSMPMWDALDYLGRPGAVGVYDGHTTQIQFQGGGIASVKKHTLEGLVRRRLVAVEHSNGYTWYRRIGP